MYKFKDALGTEWEVKLSAGTLIKICSKLNITLEQLQGISTQGIGGFGKIELATILELLPIVCAKQMKQRSISEEDFLEERITIEVIQDVMGSLMGSVEETMPEGGGAIDEDAPLPLGASETSLS